MKTLFILLLDEKIDTLFICEKGNLSVSLRHTYDYADYESFVDTVSRGVKEGYLFCFSRYEDYESLRELFSDSYTMDNMLYHIVSCNPVSVQAMAEQINY